MADGRDHALRVVAETIARYVGEVAEMMVGTRHVRVKGDGPVDFDQARPVAQPFISLDGDSRVVVPLREAEDGRFEVGGVLFDLHQRNVTTAMDYRLHSVEWRGFTHDSWCWSKIVGGRRHSLPKVDR